MYTYLISSGVEVLLAVSVLHITDGQMQLIVGGEIFKVVIVRQGVLDGGVQENSSLIGPASRNVAQSISSSSQH